MGWSPVPRRTALSRLVPNPVVVFEVISPTSGHIDWIVKVRVNTPLSIQSAAMSSSNPRSIGLTVYERQAAGQKWTGTTVMAGDLLSLPEIGIEIPAADLYEGVEFPTSDIDAARAE